MSEEKANNFITPKNVYKTDNKRDKKKYLIIIGICLGFFIALFLVLFFIYKNPAQKVYSESMAGKDAFFAAQEQLLAQDFEWAGNTLEQAIEHFESANQEFQKFKWLKNIPWLGTQISALDKLLLAGISTGKSIETINDLALEIITPIRKDDEISLNSLSEEETELLLKNVYDAKPELEKAKQSIDEAVEYIDNIPKKGLIKKIKEVTTPLQEKVPELQSAIDQAISASQIIPSIAGYPAQKTYLFLLQNNTEMRPTGGFIGTYGILKVKNGDITYFKTDNSYNLDEPTQTWLNIEPPWPLTRYNNVHQWFFRDSNWSPDFPTTAEKAEWFYHQENGSEKNIDGVIAVTPTFIQSLLALTGDIRVNGLTFNSENLIEILQYQVDEGFLRQGMEESDRKEIIGVLSKNILDQVLDLPKSKWSDLWQVFNRDITEKHILIFLKDDYVQNLIIKENWGGQIKNVEHDYLAIIDANLASLKSDPGVKRTITYTLNRDSENFIADVIIKYKNVGTITWKTTRYRTYTRLYVPKGSILLKSSGSMVDCKLSDEGSVETAEELNKTVFGTFICIEPGEEKSLTFKYKLPNSIAEQFKNDKYQLLVQKQPGTASHDLNINLKLKNKPHEITGIDDIDFSSNNDIVINSELSRDRELIIDF